MGEITSDILALSFDSLSSPSIQVKLPDQVFGSHPLGWGIAWYPNDNQAAIVKKDPAARGTSVQMETLADWNNYRSSMFFCKAKGAARGYTYHETQPFSRNFAGQEWLFMHNGDLDRLKLATMHVDKSRFLEPLGKTDSELAFMYLIGKVMETEARKLSDVPNEILLGWFQQLDSLGSADMCITDGITLACFYGTRSTRKLYYSRIQPSDQLNTFDSETMYMEIKDPRDTYRTALIISSATFNAGSWLPMSPGQLLIARRGSIVWNSQPNTSQMALSFPGLPPVPTQPNFRTQQAEQAQIHQSVVNLRSITHTPQGHQLGYRTFDITHITNYSYTESVEHSTHNFRLAPVEDPMQEVVQASFVITVPGEEILYDDVFGNHSMYYSINIPYKELSIQSRSRIKIYAPPPDDFSLSQRQSSIPLVWMPWQRQMMTPYLLPPELPETQLLELTEYAMSFVRRNDFKLMETLNDINLTIYRDYKYMPASTSNSTTAFEVYAERKGVCQDFANLFICLARLLSIPARYRMGYIYTGSSYENKIQSDASHAWVEIYIPYVGWRGFDPTNGVMVNQDHARVACGRNYIDATPTSGTIFKGGGTETLKVEVKMIEGNGMNFGAYDTKGFFDELMKPTGKPRALAMPLVEQINGLAPKELLRRQKAAELALYQQGITFSVYGDKKGTEKIMPYDIIPRIVPGDEWAVLERGLKQRIQALNLFINDIYGKQQILKDKIIPSELILSSACFLKQCKGLTPPKGIWIHITGTDLVRNSDGKYYVLEDNLRCPSGISYVLQNRAIQKRTFPQAFEAMHVQPVSDYGDHLYETLRHCSPPIETDRPNVIVLTPGIYNSAYYEHTFLAQQMGVTLAEGSDLAIVDDKVYLRTTRGLQKVDVIYRRIDDDFLDPKVFRKDSLLGVPGIMECYRKGNVTLANAPGTSIADDKAVYAYVPQIIKYYLGEDAIIPNVPTYVCWDKKQCDYVLANLKTLVVKAVNLSGGYGMLIGPQSTAAQRKEFAEKVKKNPRDYIAQPTLSLSRTPTLTPKGIEGRHVDFRPYILYGESVFVLPGGLTRVALTKGSLVVNSSQGGGSKDTWVLGDGGKTNA